jgi:hypothetical protein
LGICSVDSSSIRDLESCIYDGIKCRSSFIL